MREHSKLGCSFQIFYALQPFSMKLFSMRAYCLSFLLRSSELGNCETSEWRPVTSNDFDLHCNSFLHCQDLFTRQRRKKTKWSREVLSAGTKLFHNFILRQFLRAFYFTWQIQISIKTDRVVISFRYVANMFLSDGFLCRENIFQIAWRNVNLYRFKIM